MKKCFRCGEIKEKTEFYQHPKMSDGTLGKCKGCTRRDVSTNRKVKAGFYRAYDKRRWKTKKRRVASRKYSKNWKSRHPDYIRNDWYKRNYGITLQQYNKMLEMGKGVCWICGKPPKKKRLAVEHSHRPPDRGRVRGLACWHCNRMLIGKHTAETAKKLLAYLESDFDGRQLV